MVSLASDAIVVIFVADGVVVLAGGTGGLVVKGAVMLAGSTGGLVFVE
jgi:hypothetical protein